MRDWVIYQARSVITSVGTVHKRLLSSSLNKVDSGMRELWSLAHHPISIPRQNWASDMILPDKGYLMREHSTIRDMGMQKRGFLTLVKRQHRRGTRKRPYTGVINAWTPLKKSTTVSAPLVPLACQLFLPLSYM